MNEYTDVNEAGSNHGLDDDFTWFSNPLDWRPIDRFILLGSLVVLMPLLIALFLLAALLLSPQYINENVARVLIGGNAIHFFVLGFFIMLAFKRRQLEEDWSLFETLIIIFFLLNVWATGYATGTHFTLALLVMFLGVNLASVLATIDKIRLAYFANCAALLLFAVNDFTGFYGYAPLFEQMPLSAEGAPLAPWLLVHTVVAVALIVLLYLCMSAIRRWVERESFYKEISSIDALTRLTNRRSLIERGESELSRIQRLATIPAASMGCIMIDLDHFKLVNDKWGHQAGDVALVAVAKIMQESARQYDEVGRYGGEEFLILLPGTSTEDAMIVAERIRVRIETETIHVDGQNISLTASFGVASYPAREIKGLNDLLRAADAALYQAKEGGRNKVVLASVCLNKS